MTNPGDIFINLASVEVSVLIKGDDPQRSATDRRCRISIDKYGLATLEQYPGKLTHDNRTTHPNWKADRGAWEDAVRELLDAEILEWKAIGPEDSELFTTPEFDKLVRPALETFPDERVTWWQDSGAPTWRAEA